MTPVEGAGEPRRLAEGLARVLRGLGAPPAGALEAIFGEWAGLVGPRLASHTRPVSVEQGCLVLAVDEPGWAVQVRYSEASLLARLEERLGPGVVTRVRVRVVPPGS